MSTKKRESYDPSKIDKIASYLQIYHDRGEPIDYEIIVDNFKAVRRTNDLSMFPMYENFIDADTRQLEILLYSGNSNNNDKYIFTFKEGVGSLSGVDISAQIDEKVEQKEREREVIALKKENEELQAEINELEKEIEQLEKDKAAYEESQSPLKSVLGEFGASFVTGFLEKNPKIKEAIPGLGELTGLGKNNSPKNQNSSHGEVSFKPMNAEDATSSSSQADVTAVALTEVDQSAIAFMNHLKEQFTKDEFDKVALILETLIQDKSKIELILNHINIKNHETQI